MPDYARYCMHLAQNKNPLLYFGEFDTSDTKLCGRVISTCLFGRYRLPCLIPDTSYSEVSLVPFCPSGKCSDSTLNEATTAFFSDHSNSLFINHHTILV